MVWLELLSLATVANALPQFGGGGGGGGTAMLRFGCAQTVIDRIDPYVEKLKRREGEDEQC